MKNIAQQISGGWTFLILVLVTYGVISVTHSSLAFGALISFWKIFQKVIPILTFVFILTFLFNIFLKPKIIIKYLSKQSGLKGWLLAIGGGIISMGAIYIWYPLLADLKEKGMSNALIATFLYNRAVKLQLLPFLIYYFGWA
ncbi:MAG: hypothetical protein U9M89_01085, partial [Patescibacteria group bacterium]|nr:hypothetical protein [Patescibacteria group bacterium]